MRSLIPSLRTRAQNPYRYAIKRLYFTDNIYVCMHGSPQAAFTARAALVANVVEQRETAVRVVDHGVGHRAAFRARDAENAHEIATMLPEELAAFTTGDYPSDHFPLVVDITIQ